MCALVEHMGVNLCCFHIAVTQSLLNGADVSAGLQQVSGKGMAQGWGQLRCQCHKAMFRAFALKYPQLLEIKIDILDAQAHELNAPQPRLLKQSRHQVVDTLQLLEQSTHLCLS